MSEASDIYEDVVQAHIPVIVYIIMLMTIGLLGNPIVIYFYGFKLKATPSRMFIVSLAVFDSVTCFVSMPLELVDILRFYTFEDDVVCSALRFISYFACTSSGFMLLAIAGFRYRKICQPLKKQPSLKMTKMIIVSVLLVALSISWPVLLFYQLTAINITESHQHLTMYDCTTRRDEDFEDYITAYNAFCLLTFGISFSALMTVYSLIGKKLHGIRKFQASRITRSENQLHSKNKLSENKTVTERNEDSASDSIKNASKSSLDSSNPRCKRTSQEQSRQNRRWQRRAMKRDQEQTARVQHLRTGKYTAVMFFITVAFLITFVPFLCLMTWRMLSHEFEEKLSKPELAVFQIAVRSFLFSSACNPIIYGFLNTEFKQFVVYTSQIWLKRIRNMASSVNDRGVNTDDSS